MPRPGKVPGRVRVVGGVQRESHATRPRRGVGPQVRERSVVEVVDPTPVRAVRARGRRAPACAGTRAARACTASTPPARSRWRRRRPCPRAAGERAEGRSRRIASVWTFSHRILRGPAGHMTVLGQQSKAHRSTFETQGPASARPSRPCARWTFRWRRHPRRLRRHGASGATIRRRLRPQATIRRRLRPPSLAAPSSRFRSHDSPEAPASVSRGSLTSIPEPRSRAARARSAASPAPRPRRAGGPRPRCAPPGRAPGSRGRTR